jgi:HEAT repeat protein
LQFLEAMSRKLRWGVIAMAEVTIVRSTILAVILSVVVVARATAETEVEVHCRDILQAALADKSPDTRKHAVVALSLAGERFLSLLKDMLQDKDVEVRLATVASLAELKSQDTVAALRDALSDEAPEVSFAAAKALWGLRDAAGKEVLLAVLDGEIRTSSGVVSRKKREAVRMIQTPRKLLLFALQRGIGFAPVPFLGVGVASMQGLMSDPGASERAAAALLLANEKDPATLQALRDALTDKDWSVRAAAVHALTLRRDPKLQSELMPLLDDDHAAVRLRAAAGYLSVPVRPKRSDDNARAAQ